MWDVAGDGAFTNPIWRDRFMIGDLLIPLKPRDPLVPVIQLALRLRRRLDGAARSALHALRRLKARLG